MTSELINIEKEINFSQAKERLDDILVDTSLIYSSYFSELSGNNVYLKPENLQMTGSFKIRGAFNKVSKLTEEEKAKGIITASAGNHAQGVAYAAKALGVNATILMPETTPLIKVQSTKNFNPDANVILHGDCYDDAYEEALRLKNLHGYTFVHPFDDADVIEGQGTIALEILEQCKDADYILVPETTCGLGAGLTPEQYENKLRVIKKGISVNNPDPKDPIDVISKIGGFDIAGMVGVYLSAAKNRRPVVIDGFISSAAALCAVKLNEHVKDYLIPSHLSKEPAAEYMLEELGLEAMVNMKMRLGEGSGCPLAFQLIDTALFVEENMGTFKELKIDSSILLDMREEE